MDSRVGTAAVAGGGLRLEHINNQAAKGARKEKVRAPGRTLCVFFCVLAVGPVAKRPGRAVPSIAIRDDPPAGLDGERGCLLVASWECTVVYCVGREVWYLFVSPRDVIVVVMAAV